MKKFNKKIIVTILAIAVIFSFTGQNVAHAALAPGFLGLTSTYAVFGDAGIIGGAASTVWGDTGENAFGNGSINSGTLGTYYAAAQPLVVGAISSAYGALAAETPTGSVDLSTTTNVGPGVYTVTASAFDQTLTLTGAGTYVFQRASDIAQTAGGTMILTGGACASDVYWRTGTGMTFAAGGNIEGTIIAGSAITFANSALTFKGRALAGTNVDLGGITITEPATCTGNLTVTKEVSGGSKHVADFPLFVGTTPVTSVTSGIVHAFTPGTYAITETNNSNYTHAFSGSGCDVNGNVTIVSGGNLTCTITNTYHAPSSSGSFPRITQPTSTNPAVLTIIKQVVNNGGGTATASLFNLHVKNSGVDVLGSPNNGVAAPGIYYSLPVGTYVISEDANPSYVRTFSGDCDLNGSVTLSAGQNKTCVVTNTHIFVPSLPKTGFPTASTVGQQVKTIESNLRKGSNGGNVTTLQQFLISENKGGKAIALKDSGADGKFGPITKAALAEWQTANVLIGDGIFGQKTRAYLNAHY